MSREDELKLLQISHKWSSVQNMTSITGLYLIKIPVSEFFVFNERQGKLTPPYNMLYLQFFSEQNVSTYAF
jgi:hypothetical protein